MDFRLKVFRSVAENLSFTRAAHEMNISQPAVSKHIAELEQIYSVTLFERSGGRIVLTSAGHSMLEKVREILDCYDALAYDMQLISGDVAGELKIGASSTIAQYLLSPILADFIARFPMVRVVIESGNTKQIESMLEKHHIDIGLVEGSGKRQSLRYSTFARDELVVVTSAENRAIDSLYISDEAAQASGVKDATLLCDIPLLLRESGSGTLDVIESVLAQSSISLSDLNLLMQIGSTEAIKRYLLADKSSCAIISIISIIDELKAGRLKIVDLYGAEIERDFSFVTRLGANSERIEKFMGFVDYWYKSNIR